jgi:hypothetical protein
LYGGDSSSHPVRNGIVDALHKMRQEARQVFEGGDEVSGMGATTLFDALNATVPLSPCCCKLLCEGQKPNRFLVPLTRFLTRRIVCTNDEAWQSRKTPK